ncbi:tetratricopeptide repeat protein [Metapseudomonas lalkuanensis]|uniref:Tetratricopeptide repeat protein n=1 Tax=Metapseudomonas lalkuanensis TaxID=2604832 RepID=A0A5J6QQW4_9GAMM|nr:tetratricopeptide repeat protein [Pseudomonas lalkuanensis]QEY64884.1 tetratricopeptide repeat protein [Pseudomonas lalkuanensis]UCO97440.1 tetratricopeptide repeat protein [Pseudomonas lalkuanensis]
MSKAWIPALAAAALLAGCATPQRGAIPVVDSGAPLSELEQGGSNRGGHSPAPAAPRSIPEDSGVVVMVPGASSGAPIAAPASSAPISGSITSGGITPGPITGGPAATAPSAPSYGSSNYSVPSYSAPTPSAPSGIPNNAGGLAADEQLDGPVLALLTTAQQQQGGGDLNGAAASLERAQRIAPREPQVLYRLAEVRMAQGDAAQAEQFARRALTYSSGRPALQASLWDLIARSRDRQGDPSGAALAREKAKVNL